MKNTWRIITDFLGYLILTHLLYVLHFSARAGALMYVYPVLHIVFPGSKLPAGINFLESVIFLWFLQGILTPLPKESRTK